MTAEPRTFVIGDIHGELAHLDVLLSRLPERSAHDTLVFIGDYVDRGPDSRGVLERVWALQADDPARVVCLRGNHEDRWLACIGQPDPGFLVPPGNGCGQMLRSFTGGPPLAAGEMLGEEELAQLLTPASFLPAEVIAWFEKLPLWYEDEHALYVHAGLSADAEGGGWRHPSAGAEAPLLWQRDAAFFRSYEGKRVVFGHTPVELLPLDHLGFLGSLFDDPFDVWKRGRLVGVDTGCGKGGFLSAVELPSLHIYESRR